MPPAGDVRLEVAWNNAADQRYILTFAERGNLVAYALVEPCGAGNVIVDVNRPFSVGLGEDDGSGQASRPLPTIVDSAALPAGAEVRTLVRIDRTGAVSVEPLRGEAVSDVGEC